MSNVNDNFFWKVVNENGDLLAFQEKNSQVVELPNKQEALAEIRKRINNLLDSPMDAQSAVKLIGQEVLIYRQIVTEGKVFKEKSKIILPGR